jgi:ATP-binding cassette, subfamily B, bacterial
LPTHAEFSLPQSYESNRSNPARWVLSHAIRQWLICILAIIAALGNAILAGAVPVLTGRAFNAVLAQPSQLRELGAIALLLAGSQVLRGLMQFTRNFGFELIAQRIERDIRNELYINLLGKSMTFHSLQPVGDTMARATNDVREVNYMFSPGISVVVGSFLFLLVPLVMAPTFHPSLIITPLAFLILYILALWQYLYTLKPVTEHIRSSFGLLNTRLAEVIDGIEIVKGTAQEQHEVNRFSDNARDYRDATVQQGDLEARFLPLLLLGVSLSGGLFHALLLYSQGQLDIGQVVTYFGLLYMLGFPTFASIFAYSRISLGMAGAKRILSLINNSKNLDQNIEGYVNQVEGEVEFTNVTFDYPDEIPLDRHKKINRNRKSSTNTLFDISIKVQPGQTVAIVGHTGSGKTTFSRLINRTYDTTAGEVSIDGVNVKDWNLEYLRKNISIIEQDIFLFSRTISENIAFGKPGAHQSEIIEAAQAAQAHEFIQTFSDGYDTVIGERGVTLSGGQRQRLALARAFLTDPKILILDDATSAIDSETEDKIQRAIYAASRGRTTFLITHRLSQIRWADIILVMKHGRVSASGSHETLMSTSDAYRRIFSD